MTILAAGRTRVVAILAVILLAGAVVLAVRAFAPPAPKLVWDGGWMSSGSGPNLQGAPYTYGDMNPCVSRGSVTVLTIAPTESAGVTLPAWGSRPNPFDHGVTHIGAEDGGGKVATVEQAGFNAGPRVLRDLCRDRTSTGTKVADDYEFAIELRRTGAATGWSHGLTVTYRSGGSIRTTQWPMNYVLCGNTKPHYPDSRMDNLCRP